MSRARGERDPVGAPGTRQITVRNTRAIGTSALVLRTAADLGEAVLRAVDGWSRRQLISRPDELKVLGSVLDRALIAGEARTAVAEVVTRRMELAFGTWHAGQAGAGQA